MRGTFRMLLLSGALAVCSLAAAAMWQQPEEPTEPTEYALPFDPATITSGLMPLTEELIGQEALTKAIKSAIDRDDFDTLNKMSTDFRQSRSRTASGIWHLSLFHWRILTELSPSAEETCEDRSNDFFQRWLAKTPREPAAHVSRAAVLEAQAWCIRGGGYANTVSAEDFEAFATKVEEARIALEENRATAAIDPHYYAVMGRIFIDQGVDKAEFLQLLDEATAREPNYHYTYFDAFRYFQPQWHGTDAEVDEMARYATARTTPDERPGMYARYYWYALDCNCDGFEQSIDWSTMKQSMNALMARFPSDWNAANFARISCAMDDAQEARRWFLQVKGDYTDAFSDKQELLRCQQMAQPLKRNVFRCLFAAREGWSLPDVEKYCIAAQRRSRLRATSTESSQQR